MADRKISDLTALTTPASGDFLPIVDISEAAAATKNKRITIEELMRGMPDGTAAAPSIAFESDPNTGIYSPGADQVAISTNGTGRLFVDSSGRLGLGTSSPGNLLHVSGTGAVCQFASSNNNNVINLKGNGTTNGAWLGTTSSDDFTISSGASVTERARIDSSGRVGIGTTLSGNANNRLLVRSESASAITNVLLLNNGAANNNAGQGVRLNLSGISETNSDIRYAYIEAATQTTANDHYLAFGTNSNGTTPVERARIDSSGRLLVGTSSDSGGALFQVNGNRIRIATANTPASAGATGTTGEIAWDANYIYVCTATNTWKRTAISTW